MAAKLLMFFVFCLFVVLPFGLAQTSESELELGIAAYKNNQYKEAISHFEKAVGLDSTNPRARMYLATAYVTQYIPGIDTDDNTSLAESAITQYQRVLDLSADTAQRSTAAKGIAYLYLNLKKWDEARKYYQIASAADSGDPEPYYYIGVIDWSQCYQPRMEARAQLGMHPDEHLSSKQPDQKRVCDELQAKNWTVIEDGISKLGKAIQIRPDYDDAMAYMNLMYRERADLECSDPAARSRDLKTADKWVDKVMAMKKQRMEKDQASESTAPNPQ